jgi:hypothetical protein
VLLIGFATGAIGQTAPVNLTGQIKNQNGDPLAHAAVVICSAGPRSGSGLLCPSSYSDCGKKAATDSHGKFQIPALAPDLKFTVLAIAPGYAPATASTAAPEKGALNLVLKPRDYSRIAPNRQVMGRIIGPDGNPVVGATLDLGGMVIGDTTRYGGIKADDMAVTDENGEYHLASEEDFDALLVTLDAPGVARRWARLEPEKKQLLRMKEGGRVEGRIVFEKKPLANVWVDLGTTDHGCGVYLEGFHAMTDAQGRFVFEHVPEGIQFDLFGLMESFNPFHAGLYQTLMSPGSGQTLDLGEIQAKPAHRISGRVMLSDGKPLPAGTRMLVDRPTAWDKVQVLLDKEGRFDVEGVPEERIEITVSVKGYRFSKKNPNFDRNERGIAGRVAGDVSGLGIELEPGNPPSYQDTEQISYEEQERRSDLPFRGVSAGQSQ